jgi:hypothetical protein
MKENKKVKGGKRAGSGRKPSGRQKEAITVYTDTSKFGSKEKTRLAIYGFLDSVQIPDPEKKFPLSDREIKQKTVKEEKRPIVTDLTKPTGVLKPQEQPKTNFTVDTRPKTLDELKSRCPADLKGIDRSIWISTERQKYGI